MSAVIDWDSPLWGVAGHNTHIGTTDDLGHIQPTEEDQ